LLAACQPHGYLENAENRYGVYNAWSGDLRVYHDALLSPAALTLHSPGYVVGVEELHPVDEAFVPDAAARAAEHGITHVMRYAIPTGEGDSPPSGCAVFSLLEPDRPDPDPGHGIFTYCRSARYTAAAAEVPAAPDGCAPPPRYLPLSDDERVKLPADGRLTLSVAQGEALHRLHESLCHDLARGAYSDIVLLVMGWNTDQNQAFRNFNSLVDNLRARADALAVGFHPLVIGVTWPSELNLGPYSPFPPMAVHLVSFPSKRRYADDLGRYVLSDLLVDVLGAREEAAAARRAGGARAAGGPRLVMIGHSFGARALVNALTAPIIGNTPPTDRSREQVRHLFANFRADDRLLLLQGAVEFGQMFDDDHLLAGTLGDGEPRTIMTASDHDSANQLAFWGNYVGSGRTFGRACADPANKDRWRSEGYDLTRVGCGVVADGAEGYGFALCRPGSPGSGGQPLQRPLGDRPVRYVDASRVINCDAPFTGGGAHSDIFRPETAAFLLQQIER
jgi:hypothetical protein